MGRSARPSAHPDPPVPLRNEKRLPKRKQVEVTGYWRRQEVVVDESGALDLDATEDDGEAFHELSELAPGFVLRVAATIGLAGADSATRPAPGFVEVAEATDTAPAGVEKLLRYLTAIRITEQTDGGYRLTSLGRSPWRTIMFRGAEPYRACMRNANSAAYSPPASRGAHRPRGSLTAGSVRNGPTAP